MYSYKKFKKYYKGKSYTKYVFDKIKDMVKSTYLCLRFPFLYPRNRFSGKHWSSRKLHEKQYLIWNKWNDWSSEHVQNYIDKFGEECVVFDKKMVKVDYILKLATKKDRFLHWWYGFLNNFLSIFHCIPTYTELNGMDKGWRKRFGIQFCKELKEAIKKSPDKNYMKTFRIMQMKEKWGNFECYVNFYSPEVTRVINKYREISQYVCVDCGEDAVKKTLGWICPYCENCLPKNRNWIWIEPVYGWSSLEHEKYNKEVLKDVYKRK